MEPYAANNTQLSYREVMKVSWCIVFILAVLLSSAVADAKPKTAVKVRIEEEIGNGSSIYAGKGPLPSTYLNVTVSPAMPDAEQLSNGGKWCIRTTWGETVHFGKGGTYEAILEGDYLTFMIPPPNPKRKLIKVNFVVFDHKWRARSDIM